MPDYSKGKIYKLVCDETDEIYIGSTTNSLSNRLCEHKSKQKSGNNSTTSGELLKHESCRIILIESFECKNRQELEAREYFQITEHKNTHNVINKFMPTRSRKEHYEANREDILSKCKTYRETHKEELKEYFKNRDKTKKSASDKAYREKMGDELKEKKSIYGKTPWKCEICDLTTTNNCKNKHLKSAAHINKISADNKE